MSRKKKPLVSKPKEKVSQVLPSNQKRQGQRKEEPLPMSNTSMEAGDPQGETHPPKGDKRVWQILSYLGGGLISSAFWTAIFTGLLVYFTYLLYYVADQTERTTRSVERAYVAVKEIHMFNFAANQRVGALIKIDNVGHTPAYHLKVLGKMRSGDYPPPDIIELPYPLPIEKQKEVTLSPGGIPYAMEPRSTEPVDVAMIEAIKEGEHKRVYVWGTITYQDVFGDDHFTNYCYMYGGTLWERNEFEICPQQNDAN